MLNELLQLVTDAGSLQSRLVLVLGGSLPQRRDLLARAAVHFGAPVLPLGVEYARRMAAVTRKQRPLQAASLLRDAVDAKFSPSAPAILDRIEVLFDRSLQLDALDALKQLAHSRTVVVSWPGDLRDRRLTYAPANHPEHCDHPVAGFLVYQLS